MDGTIDDAPAAAGTSRSYAATYPGNDSLVQSARLTQVASAVSNQSSMSPTPAAAIIPPAVAAQPLQPPLAAPSAAQTAGTPAAANQPYTANQPYAENPIAAASPQPALIAAGADVSSAQVTAPVAAPVAAPKAAPGTVASAKSATSPKSAGSSIAVRITAILLAILLVVGSGFAAWWFLMRKDNAATASSQNSNSNSAQSDANAGDNSGDGSNGNASVDGKSSKSAKSEPCTALPDATVSSIDHSGATLIATLNVTSNCGGGSGDATGGSDGGNSSNGNSTDGATDGSATDGGDAASADGGSARGNSDSTDPDSTDSRTKAASAAQYAQPNVRITIKDDDVVAAAIFDFSKQPIDFSNGTANGADASAANGTTAGSAEIKVAFTTMQYWRPYDEIDASSAEVVIQDDQQPNGEPAAAVDGAMGGANLPDDDIESNAQVALSWQKDNDSADAGDFYDTVTTQLSSKKLGMKADGKTWHYRDIYQQFLQLRAKNPRALLLWSGDYPTYQKSGTTDYYVILSGESFDSADDAASWCTREKYGPNDCMAIDLS